VVLAGPMYNVLMVSAYIQTASGSQQKLGSIFCTCNSGQKMKGHLLITGVVAEVTLESWCHSQCWSGHSYSSCFRTSGQQFFFSASCFLVFFCSVSVRKLVGCCKCNVCWSLLPFSTLTSIWHVGLHGWCPHFIWIFSSTATSNQNFKDLKLSVTS
jgi:hypothetical protein